MQVVYFWALDSAFPPAPSVLATAALQDGLKPGREASSFLLPQGCFGDSKTSWFHMSVGMVFLLL